MITSKKTALFIFILFLPCLLDAQSYVSPGTVLKDTLFNRYLVSNYDGKSILQLNRPDSLKYFIKDLNYPVGMVIVDSILYVAENYKYIKGFRLKDAKLSFQVQIPAAGQLCGLTSDRKGNLYCTDIKANKLYQIGYRDSSCKILGDIISGSDLEYDAKNNRLLIVTYDAHAAVYEYSFEKKQIDALFRIRDDYGTCDGLELDSFGNIYTSSWDNDAIIYYNARDNYTMHILAKNLNNPVYMLVDQKEKNMLVPCMGNNKVVFIDLDKFFTEQEALFHSTGSIHSD